MICLRYSESRKHPGIPIPGIKHLTIGDPYTVRYKGDRIQPFLAERVKLLYKLPELLFCDSPAFQTPLKLFGQFRSQAHIHILSSREIGGTHYTFPLRF